MITKYNKSYRKFTTLGFTAMLLCTSLLSAPAEAQEEGFCGRVYEIAPGDTLSHLATRAFGRSAAFMQFYDDRRNVASLGANPNRISVGRTLYLPSCAGAEIKLAPVENTQTEKVSKPDPFAKTIDIVTGSDFAPFTDENMEFGGMLSAVVQEAFDASSSDQDAKIVFINDWGSHLETLLPDQKYDFAFPWYRPNCSDPAALSDAMRVRCDLIWSEPLFSVIIGFYTLSTTSDIPQDIADMREKRLCRPAGYFTFDLEEKGLVPGETITLKQPTGVADCFKMLEDGEVDFVTINRFTAEKAIASTGLDGFVVPIDSIITSQDLHLVAHESNPAAARLIKQFNKGLEALENSGRITSITRYFMAQHNKEVDALRSK